MGTAVHKYEFEARATLFITKLCYAREVVCLLGTVQVPCFAKAGQSSPFISSFTVLFLLVLPLCESAASLPCGKIFPSDENITTKHTQIPTNVISRHLHSNRWSVICLNRIYSILYNIYIYTIYLLSYHSALVHK